MTLTVPQRVSLLLTFGCACMPPGGGIKTKMRAAVVVMLCVTLGGCALQRAEVAQQAQAGMIGMTREKVLSCMGPPAQKATEGQTEVWAYNTSPTILLDQGTGATRFCTVNIVMAGGLVSAVNYKGPTGGLLTQGEQCAYAVNACVGQR